METNVQAYWLGHSAVKLTTPKGKIIYIDPFLKGNSTTPDDLKEVKEADFVFLTHGHEDHVGDTVEIAKNTGATVAGIVELIGLLGKEGLPEEQSIGFNKGGTVHFEEFSVTMVSANHSSSYNGQYAGDPAGLIFSFEDDICIYHMGDTNIFGDLELYGELYEPHVVFAPIGDHFTMGPEEASYAVQMLDAEMAIPVHYNTFPPIEQDPQEFKTLLEGASDTKVSIPGIGEPIF